MFAQDKIFELFIFLNDKVETYAQECEYLWRLSRSYYHISKWISRQKKEKRVPTKEFKQLSKLLAVSNQFNLHAETMNENFIGENTDKSIEILAKAGLKAAHQAIKTNEKNASAHKWYGISLQSNLIYQSKNIQLGTSFDIKKHFEKSIELNPRDPTTHHCLGCWHYEIANLPWYVISFASFMGTPYNSTVENALTCFLQAEKVQENFYSQNLYMIACAYQKMSDFKNCQIYCDKIMRTFKPGKPEDTEVIEKTKVLKNSLEQGIPKMPIST
ncbi:unnamed protein product [Gordionus sp. m RMFG-2023]